MADIRIKDLTTTASSTASDDFIAVDGTTNGTRKLNAFSPTFGGNATVTGTLTVNSTASIAGNLSVTSTTANVILGTAGAAYTYLIRPVQAGGAIQIQQDPATTSRWLSLGGADNSGNYTESLRITNAGDVNVTKTTASTTTSSGALVVSGGVGVAGAMNVGGVITTAAEYLQGSNVNFNIISTATNGNVYLKSNGGTLYLNNTAGNGDIRLGNTGTVAYVVGTSASNSTSSGALVVSGGVGVAGNINGGGAILAQGALGSIPAVNYLSTELSSGQGYITCYNGSGSAYLALNYRASQHNFTSNGAVAVQSTTASTSTSSGALVVSGGVGVAGNIWTGGQVNLAATSVEASTGINFGVANATSRDIVFFGDGTRGGMLRGYHDGSNSARLGFGYWASSGDTYTSVIDITGSATTSSQLVAIAGTAGSTSTTSGALTVAGGMGVAEAVNAGTFFGLVDGVTAPATGSGYARIYVDSADGDLKVKFGDGTVKTIATDS